MALLDSRRRASYDFREGTHQVRRVNSIFGLLIAGLLPAWSGCVDGFRGSNVQIDLSPTTPVQTNVGGTPSTGELPANTHFKIFAIAEKPDCTNRPGENCDLLFEIQRFEIHKLVDIQSPCYIDVPPNVPFPGIHVSQFGKAMADKTGISDIANPPPGATEEDKIDAATAIKRMENVAALGGDMGIKVVSTASETLYPAVDPDCNGLGLPPPTCSDEASNARRLTVCQRTWDDDPALFEGTDRILTSPLNGTTFGMVDGVNPITPAPIGGAQFFVKQALEGIEKYAIYFQTDGIDEPGTILLDGTPTDTARGVRHVHLTSPLFPTIVTGEMVIFANLGEDNVTF
jgi:hypothetical protein